MNLHFGDQSDLRERQAIQALAMMQAVYLYRDRADIDAAAKKAVREMEDPELGPLFIVAKAIEVYNKQCTFGVFIAQGLTDGLPRQEVFEKWQDNRDWLLRILTILDIKPNLPLLPPFFEQTSRKLRMA